MNRVRVGGWWASAVICVACAGSALAQTGPAYSPSPGYQPPTSDPDYFRREHDNADNWWNNSQQKQQQQQQLSWWPSSWGDPEAPSAEHLMTWMTWLLVAGTAVIVLWLGVRVLVRLRPRAADPTKLALNDPWVRAHLAKSGGRPEDLQFPKADPLQ